MKYLLILLIPLVAIASTEFIKKDRIFFGEGTAQDYQFFFDVGSGSGNNPYMMWDESKERIVFPFLQVESTTQGARPYPAMSETQRDNILSPGSGDTVFNLTSATLNVYDGTEWGEVGAGGGAGDVENSIKFPGFGDEEDIFTHTIGAGAVQETGGHLDTTENPSPFVRLTTGTTHDHVVCRTLPVDRQYEVGCYVKSALDDIDVCFASNASTNKQCNSSYDGSSEYKYVFQRQTPQTGEDVCLRIVSSSTSDIDVDSCRIGEVKFSTAELSKVNHVTIGDGSGGNQSIAHNTWTTIISENTFNSGDLSMYNAGTGVFTAPEAGLYDLSAFQRWDDSQSIGNRTELRVLINGTKEYWLDVADSQEIADAADHSGNGGSVSLELNAGDTIEFQVYQASGSNRNLDISRLSVAYIAKSTNVLTAVENDQPAKRTNVNTGTIPNNQMTFLDYTNSSGSEFFDPNSNYKNCGNGHQTLLGDPTGASTCQWNPPRSGKILTCASVQLNGSVDWTATELSYMEIFKDRDNGKRTRLDLTQVPVTPSSSWAAYNSGCAIVNVVKDEPIFLGYIQNSGNPRVPSGSFSEGHWEVSYIDAKALLAGLEDISVAPVRYSHTLAQSIPSGGGPGPHIINFDSLTFDKDGLVTTGASWVYTVPKNGYYEVCAHVGLENSAIDYNYELSVFKNGVFNAFLFTQTTKDVDTGNARRNETGCDTIEASVGDTLDLRVFQDSGAAINLSNAARNYVVIKRHEATLSAGADIEDAVTTPGANTALHSCKINNNGTATKDASSGLCDEWIGTPNRTSTGSVTIPYNGSPFFSTPNCTVSASSVNDEEYCYFDGEPSTSQIIVKCRVENSLPSDRDFMVICHGKR